MVSKRYNTSSYLVSVDSQNQYYQTILFLMVLSHVELSTIAYSLIPSISLSNLVTISSPRSGCIQRIILLYTIPDCLTTHVCSSGRARRTARCRWLEINMKSIPSISCSSFFVICDASVLMSQLSSSRSYYPSNVLNLAVFDASWAS